MVVVSRFVSWLDRYGHHQSTGRPRVLQRSTPAWSTRAPVFLKISKQVCAGTCKKTALAASKRRLVQMFTLHTEPTGGSSALTSALFFTDFHLTDCGSMSQLVLDWLNKDVCLSRKVKIFERDFANGYLFGELLYKHGLLQAFEEEFVDESHLAAKRQNFSMVQQALREAVGELGVKLSNDQVEEIMDEDRGSSLRILYQLRRVLSTKAKGSVTMATAQATGGAGRPRLQKQVKTEEEENFFDQRVKTLRPIDQRYPYEVHNKAFVDEHTRQLRSAREKEYEEMVERSANVQEFRVAQQRKMESSRAQKELARKAGEQHWQGVQEKKYNLLEKDLNFEKEMIRRDQQRIVAIREHYAQDCGFREGDEELHEKMKEKLPSKARLQIESAKRMEKIRNTKRQTDIARKERERRQRRVQYEQAATTAAVEAKKKEEDLLTWLLAETAKYQQEAAEYDFKLRRKQAQWEQREAKQLAYAQRAAVEQDEAWNRMAEKAREERQIKQRYRSNLPDTEGAAEEASSDDDAAPVEPGTATTAIEKKRSERFTSDSVSVKGSDAASAAPVVEIAASEEVIACVRETFMTEYLFFRGGWAHFKPSEEEALGLLHGALGRLGETSQAASEPRLGSVVQWLCKSSTSFKYQAAPRTRKGNSNKHATDRIPSKLWHAAAVAAMASSSCAKRVLQPDLPAKKASASFKAASDGSSREVNSERSVHKAEVVCRSCTKALSLCDRVCPWCECAPSFSLSGNFNLKGALRVLHDGRHGGGDACNLVLLGHNMDRDQRVVVKAFGLGAWSGEVPTLYVYDHCPYCVRARMIFGLKKTPFKLDFLMNDDVVTPTKMIGKKVLPIMEIDGEAMGESLDIVAKVDALDDSPLLAKAAGREDIAKWLSDNKDLLRKITRPRDAMALYPEFSTKAARATWVKNHQLSGMTFEEALATSEPLMEEFNSKLPELSEMLHSSSSVNEGGYSYDDITLFPTLRRLTLVKGIHWPEKLRQYTEHMAEVCDVPLLDGMAARLDEDPEEVATIKEEIQIQSQLAHDNTVPLLYAAETPSEVVLVMPFAAGGDLHAAMGPRGMLPEKQAARLCGQLLEGLRYLHQDLYILHGDVKPRNIFLVPAGPGLVVQLGDFGLARECPRKAPFLCHFAGLQGSHGYMAPEILSEQDYGRPVDVFALGVIMFTLLAGYEPFYPPSNVHAPLEFDPPSWAPLSKESAEFVTDLLRVAAE
ncbi:grxB, partial [Symbiodinium necroappetens]